MAGRRCLWLAGVVLGAVALGCSGETARIKLHVEVADSALESAPWLRVTFDGYDDVVWIDPATGWQRSPLRIDLQFQVSGVGSEGVKVDVFGYPAADDTMNAILEGHAEGAKPGGVATVVSLIKPMTIKGDAGMPDADGGAPDGKEPDGGGPDTGEPDSGKPDVHVGDGGDGGDVTDERDAAPPDIVCTDDAGPDADAGPQGPTCDAYCELMVKNCMDDSASCQLTCTQLRWDQIKSTSPAGNNLTCRVLNAMLAEIPTMTADKCAIARWDGAEMEECGTPCDVYCDAGKVICPAEAIFSNVTCRDTCRAFTKENRSCRVQALIDSECAKAANGTGCP